MGFESNNGCSICLEVVIDGGKRSIAKLECGHVFHLDCIGSAFNAKGEMKCPNCRNIEKGNWLYANGSRSSPSLDDLSVDEDLYISQVEMEPPRWLTYRMQLQVGSTTSFSSTLVHPCITIPRAHAHAYDHYQHRITPRMHGSTSSGPRRSRAIWGSPSVRPAPPLMPPDQTSHYYPCPPTASSSRGPQEIQNAGGDHFYSWDGDHYYASYSSISLGRDLDWYSHPHQSNGLPDSSIIWPRNHAYERPAPQGRTDGPSFRPAHAYY